MSLIRIVISRNRQAIWLGVFCFAIAFAVAACSSQTVSHTNPRAQTPAAVAPAEACSTVGAMACKAAALFSGGGSDNPAATCVVVGSAGGGRVESCGGVQSTAPASAAKQPRESYVTVRLAWADNSHDESRFIIERCDRVQIKNDGGRRVGACTGSWTVIGAVLANVTSYLDNTALPKQTYLYRVKAANDSGSSSYTNEALITAPFK